jgi:micrococcal nuclease
MKKSFLSFKSLFGKLLLLMGMVSLLSLTAPTVLANTKPTGELEGKVVYVIDGDTVTVLSDNTQYRIRLNGIDAPEKSQAYGNKSKEYLRSMVYQKYVTVTLYGHDRYGRYIGMIHTDDIDDVNGAMIQAGMAWHYAHYYPSEEYAAYQRDAQEAGLGLWADSNPIPPWEFRKWKRNR